MTTVADLQDDAQTYAGDLGDTIDAMVTDIKALRDITIEAEPIVTWAGHTFFDPLKEEWKSLMDDKPKPVERAAIDGTTPTFPDDIQEIEAPEKLTFDAAPTKPDDLQQLSEVEDIKIDDAPEFPKELQEIEPPSDIVTPTFDATSPDVTIPDAPTIDIGETPSPVDPAAVAIPDVGEFAIPTLPAFADVTIPVPPVIDLPTFAGVAPSFDLTPPTNSFAFAETPYASSLMDAIDETLWSDIENGGFGIHTDDEAQLLDRAAERERDEGAKLVDQAAVDFAARRFDLPPGALAEMQSRARNTVAAQVNALNREIMLKRFDKFAEARQFALQQGISLENMRLTFHGAMMERWLNAAKYMNEAAIAFYNAQVETLKIQQAQYEAEGRVYETLIRARGLQLEQFRSQLEGERLRGELNRVRLDTYRAQVEVVRTLLDIFNARMKGAELQQGIERAKVEAYRARVEAFSATLKAQELKLGIFDASVRGEEAKVRVYQTQAQAYESRVRGVGEEANIARARLEAQIARAKAQTSKYESQVRGFEAGVRGQEARASVKRTKIESEVARARGQVEIFNAEISAYNAGLRGKEAQASIDRTILESQVERAKGQIAIFEGQLKGFVAQFETSLKQENLKFDEAKVNAELFRARAAAVAENMRAAVEAFQSNKDDFLGVLRHNLEKARYLLQLQESNRNWKGEITSKAASFYVPVASAALSAINTLGVLSTES